MRAFDRAALAIERIEAAGERERAASASSASKHSMPIFMSSMRPAAFRRGATAKARPAAVRSSATVRPRACSSARMPATQRPARMRLMPCATSTRLLASSGTTSATVPERDEVQGTLRPAGAPWREHARGVEPAFEPRHDVEGDADAGERRAANAAAGEVRIDDRIRLRQRLTRQVVIGDQHIEACVRAAVRHAWQGSKSRCRR